MDPSESIIKVVGVPFTHFDTPVTEVVRLGASHPGRVATHHEWALPAGPPAKLYMYICMYDEFQRLGVPICTRNIRPDNSSGLVQILLFLSSTPDHCL